MDVNVQDIQICINVVCHKFVKYLVVCIKSSTKINNMKKFFKVYFYNCMKGIITYFLCDLQYSKYWCIIFKIIV